MKLETAPREIVALILTEEIVDIAEHRKYFHSKYFDKRLKKLTLFPNPELLDFDN